MTGIGMVSVVDIPSTPCHENRMDVGVDKRAETKEKKESSEWRLGTHCICADVLTTYIVPEDGYDHGIEAPSNYVSKRHDPNLFP